MSRCYHACCDFFRQNSNLTRFRCFSILSAIALGLIPNAAAMAGSVAATIQVRARIVSSCRVSANSLQSTLNTNQGRFNCPVNSQSATLPPAAAYGESANYTLSDVPGTDGAVKILTLNF